MTRTKLRLNTATPCLPISLDLLPEVPQAGQHRSQHEHSRVYRESSPVFLHTSRFCPVSSNGTCMTQSRQDQWRAPAAMSQPQEQLKIHEDSLELICSSLLFCPSYSSLPSVRPRRQECAISRFAASAVHRLSLRKTWHDPQDHCQGPACALRNQFRVELGQGCRPPKECLAAGAGGIQSRIVCHRPR